jgi:hypothetical protein
MSIIGIYKQQVRVSRVGVVRVVRQSQAPAGASAFYMFRPQPAHHAHFALRRMRAARRPRPAPATLYRPWNGAPSWRHRFCRPASRDRRCAPAKRRRHFTPARPSRSGRCRGTLPPPRSRRLQRVFSLRPHCRRAQASRRRPTLRPAPRLAFRCCQAYSYRQEDASHGNQKRWIKKWWWIEESWVGLELPQFRHW